MSTPEISSNVVIMTRDELELRITDALKRGIDEGLSDPAAFRPIKGDIVVRNHGAAKFFEVGDGEQSAGYEVIHPWTRRTTFDRLDIGEMLRAVLSLCGEIDVSPMIMLTPEQWAARKADARQRNAGATIPLPTPLTPEFAEVGPSPLEIAAAKLVSMVDGPDDALTPEMREACDAVRALLPEGGR